VKLSITNTPTLIAASIAESGGIMPEPREEDDIALGLDEEEIEDETYDTLDEKYGDD
jgi:hypothetical protein